MFRFHDVPPPVAVRGLHGQARLAVVTPHWSASVALIDNALQPVLEVEKVRPGETDADGRFEALLPPGAYQVRVTLNGATQSMWVTLPADHEVELPAAIWDELSLTSSMPLPGVAPDALLRRSIDETSPYGLAEGRSAGGAAFDADGPAAAARLTLFVTPIAAPSDAAPRPFTFDVQILDENDDIVVDLSADPPPDEDGVWRCGFDLPYGYYVLRVRDERPATNPTHDLTRRQPIYLSAVESHVFLYADGAPLLATMTLAMARRGKGLLDDDVAVAVDAVLTALGGVNAAQAVLGSERIVALLKRPDVDPWLGILAGYALVSRDGTSRPDPEAAALLDHLTTILPPLVGDHPDLRALAIGRDGVSCEIDYPPMLRVGLQRVRAAAKVSVMPDGPLSRMPDCLIADSPWTAWSEQCELRVAPVETEGSFGRAIPAFAHAFPSHAPVYTLSTGPAAGGPARLAADAEMIGIATGILIEACTSDGNAVPPPTPATTLSAAPPPASDDEGAIALKAKLTDVVTHRIEETAAGLAEVARGGSADWLLATPLEDQIDQLRREATRLRGDRNERGDRHDAMAAMIADAVGNIAERLDGLADRLTERGHLVIIAGSDGELRYGNRLLRDRLDQRAEPAEVVERLGARLAAQAEDRTFVPAKELSPTSPEAERDVTVEIQRRPLRGEDGQLRGNVFLLRDAAVRDLSPDTAKLLETVLPQISLHALLAERSTGEECARSVDQLNRLIYRLEAAPG